MSVCGNFGPFINNVYVCIDTTGEVQQQQQERRAAQVVPEAEDAENIDDPHEEPAHIEPRWNRNVPHVPADEPFPAVYKLPVFAQTLKNALQSENLVTVMQAMKKALGIVMKNLEPHLTDQ